MRSAALILGLIGGIGAMGVGFFGYAFAILADLVSTMPAAMQETLAGPGAGLSDPGTPEAMALSEADTWRLAGLLAPILAIMGAAMAPRLPLIAGLLMGVGAWAIFDAYGFNLFTMFPISMCGTGAALALLSGIVGLGR